MAKLVNEFDNKVLSRKEIVVDMDSTGATPSAEDIEKRLSEAFKVGKDVIAVRKITTAFGDPKVRVEASLYYTKEDKEKTEPAPKKKKAAEGKPAAPAAPKEEKPKEEAPAEKEEAPKEEKPSDGKEEAKE